MAVIAGAIVVALVLRGDDGLSDPKTVSLPEGTPAPGVVEYLAGPGAPIVAFTKATGAFLMEGQATSRDCREITKSQLLPLGEPATLADLAASIPDRPTADLAVAHVASTIDFIDRCVAGVEVNRDEFRFTRVVLTRRFKELGVIQ